MTEGERDGGEGGEGGRDTSACYRRVVVSDFIPVS